MDYSKVVETYNYIVDGENKITKKQNENQQKLEAEAKLKTM